MAKSEKSEALEALEGVASGAKDELRRLKGLHAKGKLSANLADEVVSTILPLVIELAERTVEHGSVIEEWAEEIDDLIDDGELGAGGPTLELDEVELFGWLFSRLQEFISGAKSAPNVPDEMRAAMSEIEKKLAVAGKILNRFTEEEDGEERQQELEAGTGSEGTTDDEPDDGAD